MKFINEKEIWLLDLEPTKGIELKKIRPCLVLKKFSKKHLIILPITSQKKSKSVSFKLESIKCLKVKTSFVNISQIRCVDSSRFIRRFGEIGHGNFFHIKNKTAEVLKLLPQGATAHNVSEL